MAKSPGVSVPLVLVNFERNDAGHEVEPYHLSSGVIPKDVNSHWTVSYHS